MLDAALTDGQWPTLHMWKKFADEDRSVLGRLARSILLSITLDVSAIKRFPKQRASTTTDDA
uniref:Uncharacterized protein n=1 Tax=Pristionchus pacificus TaxID=54126 RepID=A0A2A6CCT2_PRIPA|eukprot:PDM75811.1 hypothetical protein PRIPAC_40190 [Pristionchus pacificus]